VPWLIPVRFEDCPVPDIDLGGGRTLGSIQRADLFGDRREAETNRLVTTAQRLLGQQSEEQRIASAKQTEALRLQIEELQASLEQQAQEAVQRQQRAQAGEVYVWEERMSHDPRALPDILGEPSRGVITAHVKNGSDQPVYEVTLVWHRGTARWGGNDNPGTLIPGHEAERTRGLPLLPDYADPSVWGAVAFFRDTAGTWWRARPDGQLHDVLPEQVPRG